MTLTRLHLTAMLAIVLTIAAVTTAVAVDPGPDSPPRIAFVANGRNPADALAVGPTAGMLGAPVFTTNTTTLPPATATGLEDYAPELVIALGGTAAITDAVLFEIAEATGLGIRTTENPDDGIVRVAGADRFGTAAAIADLLSAYGRAFEPNGEFALADQTCGASQVMTGVASDGTVTCRAEQTLPLFAVVTAEGVLDRGRGAVSASKGGGGTYSVEFETDISDCAFNATIGQDGGAGGEEPGFIMVNNVFDSETAVFVQTLDADAAAADRGFHLTVVC